MRYLLCLLLVSSVYAVEPNGDSIKADAWASTSIPSGGTAKITDANSLKWINDGIQLISTNLPAYMRLDTVWAKKNKRIYDMMDTLTTNGDFDSIAWILRLVGDSQYIPQEASTPEGAYLKRQGVIGATDDPVSLEDPRNYWTHGRYLFFYPQHAQTFGESTALLVAYYAVAPPLAVITDQTVIDEKYLPMLVDYVCGRIKEAQSDEYWAAWFFSKVPFLKFRDATK
jgi:hypothetical protein